MPGSNSFSKKAMLLRPFAHEESWHRKTESSSLCLSVGSTEERGEPHTGNRNAHRAGLVGHMQVCIKKGEGVLQGTPNKLVSFNSAGYLICTEQRFHYSRASPRDCTVMKPRHCGPELRRLREQGDKGWEPEPQNCYCCCCCGRCCRHHCHRSCS